jgi:hypothetical protein
VVTLRAVCFALIACFNVGCADKGASGDQRVPQQMPGPTASEPVLMPANPTGSGSEQAPASESAVPGPSGDPVAPAAIPTSGGVSPSAAPQPTPQPNPPSAQGQAGESGNPLPTQPAEGGAAGTNGAEIGPGQGGAPGQGGESAGGTSGGPDEGTPDAGLAPNSQAPVVDRADPQLYAVQFPANEADPAASQALGRQHAYLDTRVAPLGKLVVYLHGAGQFNDCGSEELSQLVASFGFHWFGPCYSSDYGVDNCGDDIAGCRLEALDGQDHHSFVNIGRPDSIEERIVRGLAHLQDLNPEGDWTYFVDGDQPRWSEIVITGHSHGASTSGLIGVTRNVARVVMLAGPNDVDQAWLSDTPVTAPEQFYGFSHNGDGQHQGHLAAFESLGLPGEPTNVDGSSPPFGDSHRLYSAAGVGDPHGSVTSGSVAAFVPAWTYLYTGQAP